MPSVDAPGDPHVIGDLPVELFRPEQPNGGAVVLGVEATGPNRFIRGIARRLAALGYLVAAPDYYRGSGLPDPDDYSDLVGIHRLIGAMDFRQGALDVLETLTWVRGLEGVDPERVATWGYCTGATLSLLAACLDRRLASSVNFYPSQPRLPQIDDLRPSHLVDLIWAIRAPALILYGENDAVLPPELRAEFQRRMEVWRVPGEMIIYPDAEHVFAGCIPERHNAVAAADAWSRAADLLARTIGKSKETL